MTAYELGVDVSKWQVPDKIDWLAIKEQGYSFIFARHSYGTSVDTQFLRHALRASRAGFRVSAYQYLVPHNIRAQAMVALQIAGDLSMPYVLDVEQKGLTKTMIDDWIAAFTNGNSNLIIYTSRFAWLQCYGNAIHDYGKKHELWVANYTQAPLPLLPNGWKDWQYWQFTSTGRLQGYNADLDLNRCKAPWKAIK